ncbi:MAG: hypothetical protein JSV90_06675 [Methanobacteriota archaeon]|nr:MAG: hypothetical protein JSV90_06675 [Euryarchaeota archaeon]
MKSPVRLPERIYVSVIFFGGGAAGCTIFLTRDADFWSFIYTVIMWIGLMLSMVRMLLREKKEKGLAPVSIRSD